MATGTTGRTPAHPLAWAGLGAAVAAAALALYGSMYAEKHLPGSPLRDARGGTAVPSRPASWLAKRFAAAETFAFGGDFDAKVLAATERSKIANYSLQLVAFVLPFVLGVGGALAGGSAMGAAERSGGRYAGHAAAVFAMLIGGLAAVTAGCMMLGLYVWPHLPSLYTT